MASTILLYDIRPLLPALEASHPIITPNRRLSAKIHKAYDEHKKKQFTAWPTPHIEPLESWLTSILEAAQQQTQSLSLKRLLSTSEAEWLWEQAIHQVNPHHGLLRVTETAQVALRAYHQLRLWQQPLNSEELQQTEDSRLLVKWAIAFETLCENHQAQTLVQGIHELFDKLQDQPFDWPQRLYLVEFDDIPPLYEALFKRYVPNHHKVNAPGQPSQVFKQAIPDQYQEFYEAAVWAQDTLETDRNAVIGIIAPKLNEWRAPIEQAFNQVFEPQTFMPDSPRYTSPFNFSAGESLGECPIIHAALLSLWFLHAEIPLNILRHLLLSPFLMASDHPNWLSQGSLEAYARQSLNSTISLRWLKAASAPDGKAPSPVFWQRLQALEEIKRTWSKPTSCSQWVMRFKKLLDTLGWPGQRRLDSTEYQQVAQWYETLLSLERYDDFVEGLDWQGFFQLATQVSKQAVFQAQTPDSPIQILGMLEGAGLRFTHLWIMGLNDKTWPTPASPNPFIPAHWQQLLNMPHASNQRELIYAKQLTERYAHSAQKVIFSFSERDGDQELRPSPLIVDYPPIVSSSHSKQPDSPFDANGSVMLEKCEEAQAPAVTEQELTLIRGGSAIIKSQAACPFIAFAKHRLNAKPLAEPSLGLSPWEMGETVHYCLELFWRQVKTQQQLLALDKHSIKNRLIPIIESALSYLTQRHPRLMKERFTQLQRQRLEQLLLDWLELEKQRHPFTVARIEHEVNVSLSGLPLHLRIDRIDRSANGEILLIDYKTHQNSLSSWFSQRPTEPQLPLYFIGFPQKPDALAFAHVNTKNCAFSGIANESKVLPNIKTLDKIRNIPEELSWQSLHNYWYDNLNRLAQDFLNGHATIDPKKTNSYDYTGLKPLARLNDFSELAKPWMPRFQLPLI